MKSRHMCGTYGTYGGKKNTYTFLERTPEGIKPLKRLRRR
jgi:hypothetical protein